MKAVQTRPAVSAEHEFEAQHGLPEPLPANERILWQGSPAPGLVAQRVFHIRWIAGYFALMLVWRLASQLHDGVATGHAVVGLLVPGLVAAVGLALLAWLAQATAHTTVYTLTDKRLVLRIGIVLTVSYNLPLRSIDAAHVLPLGDGRAEIALSVRAGTRLAYLHMWPHTRAWHIAHPQPMLRCLEDGAAVAERLVTAWSGANAQAGKPARVLDADVPAHAPRGELMHPRSAG